MSKMILALVALAMVGGSMGTASAFISTEKNYDVAMAMSGTGKYAFGSIPVSADMAGLVGIADNFVSKTMRTYDGTPLAIDVIVNGEAISAVVELKATENTIFNNGQGWATTIKLGSGVYEGLSSLDLKGTLLEGENGDLFVTLKGTAVYNNMRVNLDFAGAGSLSEYTGPSVQ